MTQKTPDTAFILAAGFGSRLKPHTLTTPKPLVTINDKPLLDYILDHLETAGVKKTIINTHHLAEKIETYTQTRTHPKITLSREDEILETGGGLIHAIDLLPKDDPFYIINGDSFWLENSAHTSALQTLNDHWNPETMDILMLMQPVETMTTSKGVGDYHIAEDGKATRSLDQSGTHMFTSIRINHPRIFKNAPSGAFSYLKLMDEAQEKGRLYAVPYAGEWHHISTPIDLKTVRDYVQQGKGQGDE